MNQLKHMLFEHDKISGAVKELNSFLKKNEGKIELISHSLVVTDNPFSPCFISIVYKEKK